MRRTGLWLRVFVGLLAALVPPVVVLLAAQVVAEDLLRSLSPPMVAGLVLTGILIWAALLAVVFERALSDDVRSLLALASRGARSVEPRIGTPYDVLATTLEERDRQVSTLAREAARLSITEAPLNVVSALLVAVRGIMADNTWRLAVLKSPDPDLLPVGVYDAGTSEEPSAAISDLEQWAAGARGDAPVAIAMGPWGAFNIVQVTTGDPIGATLIAPWEGRPPPSPGEIAFLRLVGQHAGTALEHSLLYARVSSQAEALNRLTAVQTDFLRGVTHDLQTPLTSISALAAELKASPGLAADVRRDLETIGHQADRLRRMVAQLLVASRVEAGAVSPQHDVFAVQPVIHRTWAAFRADRPFELNVRGPAHLAVADPDRFEQVLWAVLDNAVKYSPAGSPITVDVEPQGSWLTVRVKDCGMGMDDLTRQGAFDQFFRADEARRLAPDGSGVGLYAARGLMLAMGGDVEVESKLGSGTEILLRLPAEASEDAE